MKDRARVVAIQMPIPTENGRDENLSIACDLLDRAGSRQPDLVCLPELCVGLKVISTIPGVETEKIGEVARKYGMYVVAPLYIQKEEGVFNCSVLFGRNGAVAGCYEKVHLWPWEAPVFGVKAGSSFPVFITDFSVLGLCICHDHQFPETSRSLALTGAEIIHCATRMPDPFQLPWLEFSRIRALENQVYVVSVGSTFNECSTHIVAPRFRGAVLAASGPGTHLIEAELDLDWLRKQRRVSPLYNFPNDVPNQECEDRLKETESHCFLRERRPEAYSGLTEWVGETDTDACG
ncbi:MAG: carbon-nitrogen hydrolase family protein [Spirochaetaceae bacterium]|nr:MAG: carbon-nitrogen hydrolase family protein [Spirochaetaceae bacterium]